MRTFDGVEPGAVRGRHYRNFSRAGVMMKQRVQLVCRIVSVAGYVLLAGEALATTKPEPIVYYPAGASEPVPVAVWLHGLRVFPSVLEDKEYFQRIADQLKIAIVGIPGTTALYDGTLVWSEEPVADQAYLQDVLDQLASKYKLDKTRVALFGFSEGAMVAADLCARYPNSYRGAILMSPGGITNPKAEPKTPDLNKSQVFFIFCGAKESEKIVQNAAAYAGLFKKLGCTVTHKEYPDQEKHTRPEDFKEEFPIWIAAILGVTVPDQAKAHSAE
jgi:predicted esterase